MLTTIFLNDYSRCQRMASSEFISYVMINLFLVPTVSTHSNRDSYIIVCQKYYQIGIISWLRVKEVILRKNKY